MSWLTDILKEYPALAVARERLALIEERLQVAEQQNERLTRELQETRAERDALKLQINKRNQSLRLLQHRGVCWEVCEGEVEALPYCPECHLAMHEFPPRSDETLVCSKCSYVAPFLPSEIEKVAKSLEARLLSL